MMSDRTHPETTANDEQTYSLNELTDEAGVSVRTVRYYIAEGLLPPPATAGPRSHYTQSHLDRLRLIDRMKAAYLPLKEIRRRLTSLDDDEIRNLVVPSPSSPAMPSRSAPPTRKSRPPDGAASYIARLLQSEPLPAPRAPAPAAPTPPEVWDNDSEFADELFLAETLAPPFMAEEDAATTTWRRVPLTDEAELLIREDVYERKRDRIDWLIGWARKVFH